MNWKVTAENNRKMKQKMNGMISMQKSAAKRMWKIAEKFTKHIRARKGKKKWDYISLQEPINTWTEKYQCLKLQKKKKKMKAKKPIFERDKQEH